ncbi:bifunctional (p)ppGpp synthetase/guanosine-3',5'-bis(diphosphate) 3'-pyrophosphohydrolase [Sulfuritalea sp.]|uniref:RelA/SpoT family protein n=1 Tax=Sulfuritalea sp. TaxID=2480090 RepID=UPI0025FC87C1|nr:bifunctional (p)ppGpp synthetase/guanosine-3',5'-bis(diphosphate) 3'-pyrophosphohydrolase [Sulfuritalea sp.]
MHPPVDLAEDLERFNARLATYLKPEDITRVGAAYVFSDAAHRGQMRVSGGPYITHPLAVAETLAGWHLDAHALMAALLHDVMEDTSITKEQIAERFGKVAAELVDGVSKLDRIEHQSFEEAQAENFRKMLLAMARDVRVILIKLADRLHNMQTLDAMRPEKRRRIARETLDIYAPIANRLGLNALYRELQELAFRHAHPLRYRVLSKAVKGARGNRREVVSKILDAIRQALPAAGIDADVKGREKHLYGIYRKMRDKHLSFSQVLDIYGFRIIVKDRPTCYLALGALHALYQPVPGKFKDYIAIPKANGYQSLHTTLIGPFGTPAEIQIRDADMHHVAESGVASHWLYKDETTLDQLQKKTHKWLQSLVELQSASGDSSEFLEHVKVDLFPGEVYVFSPRGKIFALPRGSTPVDLAYAVHTDIGDRCVACRINFETMPLRTELRNGDRVEIITEPNAAPNPAWLGYVKSARARSKIRHFLNTRHAEESAALGERLLSHALRDLGLALAKLPAQAWERFKRASGARSQKAVLAEIGLGKRLPAIVARRLAEGVESTNAATEARGKQAILIHGPEGVAVKLGNCCRPIPGDPIVGLIRKGQGLVVHTHDCTAIAKLRSERGNWVDVEWEADIKGMFEASIRVIAKNVRGVLARIAAGIAEAGSNIVNISMDDDSGEATTLFFTLQVTDRIHLARILRSLRRVPEVVRITRYVDAKPRKEN